MAASWIAQLGEGLSETGGRLLHCHERAAQNALGLRPRNSRRQHERIADFSHRVEQHEIVASGSRQLRQSTRRSSTSMDGDGSPFHLFDFDRNPHVHRLAWCSRSRPAGRKIRSGLWCLPFVSSMRESW